MTDNPVETRIERVWLRARARKLGEREVSGHSFQRWLGEWRALDAMGWDVSVVLAPDESHAVGMACRAREAQLSLLDFAA